MSAHNLQSILLNGSHTQIQSGSTVAALVDTIAGHQPVAVALNQQVLPKRLWQETLLQPQDQVLLFELVAGG